MKSDRGFQLVGPFAKVKRFRESSRNRFVGIVQSSPEPTSKKPGEPDPKKVADGRQAITIEEQPQISWVFAWIDQIHVRREA